MTYSWPAVLFVVVNAVVTNRVAADVCLSRHFHDIQGKDVDDYIIYGLTQDCQIFFIRPSQIALLSTINVNIHNSYCYPNLVQLHLKSHNSLLLVTKQAGNRICTLDVQIPPTEMLFGDHLFSYSLLSSLPYASCSHSPPQMFRLEPDLSFLDTVFNDVIYFIDAHSTGALWTVHQFQINAEGFLKHLEKISINNHAKPLEVWTGPDLASEYVVALDNQRNYIFVRNRFERSMLFECAYDLLFRPNTLVTHHLNTTHEGRPWLNSMGADLNLLLYTETDRSRITAITLGCSQPTVSRIIAQVSDLFYRRRKEFIKWPEPNEQQNTQRRFLELCGIPNVVGALDGSHVKIIAPSVSEDSYVNRKDFHSINMAAVCDLDQRFLWVSAKYPGRAHDSRVFRSSVLYRSLQTGRKTGILLADSAYRSERFLLKPILRENRTAAETRYTDAVCRGRVVIENAFGSLKRQFQALHTELRHSPARSAKIIVAACCLRNYCIQTRERSFTEDEAIAQQYPEAGNEDPDLPDVGEGDSMRRFIVENYFA